MGTYSPGPQNLLLCQNERCKMNWSVKKSLVVSGHSCVVGGSWQVQSQPWIYQHARLPARTQLAQAAQLPASWICVLTWVPGLWASPEMSPSVVLLCTACHCGARCRPMLKIFLNLCCVSRLWQCSSTLLQWQLEALKHSVDESGEKPLLKIMQLLIFRDGKFSNLVFPRGLSHTCSTKRSAYGHPVKHTQVWFCWAETYVAGLCRFRSLPSGDSRTS